MAHSILRLPAVKARTGLSRSTIYLRIAKGTFPAPISLGARASAGSSSRSRTGSTSKSLPAVRSPREFGPR